MIGPEELAAGERAEAAGDFLAAATAYRAVTALPDQALAADAWFHLGRVIWRQGRFDGALAAFQSALALATRTEDRELLARVENGIGAVHYARGEYAKARQAYASAQARTTDLTLRGKIILNLGVIENIEGNFEGARQQYEVAYQLFMQSEDPSNAMLAVHNRGMVEADLGRWEDADRSFLASLSLATEAGNREMIAKTLVNRSEVLLEQGVPAEAVEHCDRALGIYADVGDEIGRAEALRWRGRSLIRMRALAEGERNITEALHIAVRSQARLLEAEASLDLGMLRMQRGDPRAALKQLRNTLALFTELGATREIEEVKALMSRARTALDESEEDLPLR